MTELKIEMPVSLHDYDDVAWANHKTAKLVRYDFSFCQDGDGEHCALLQVDDRLVTISVKWLRVISKEADNATPSE